MTEKEKHIAFMNLYEPTESRLSRFAMAMSKTKEDASDLVSDTVLAAYESFEKLKQPDAFLSYLFTIASRIAKRRNWRKKLFGFYDEEQAINIPSLAPSPDSGLDLEALYNALSKLSSTQREAVALFDISGFSLKEIQELQGGTLSGVKSRITRGREKLAKILGVENDFQHTEKPSLQTSNSMSSHLNLAELRVNNEK